MNSTILYVLSIGLFTFFIIYISIEYIFRKWKCNDGKCQKMFGGDYSSENECIKKCTLIIPPIPTPNNSPIPTPNNSPIPTPNNSPTNYKIESPNIFLNYPDYDYGYGYYPYYPTSLLYNYNSPYRRGYMNYSIRDRHPIQRRVRHDAKSKH